MREFTELQMRMILQCVGLVFRYRTCYEVQDAMMEDFEDDWDYLIQRLGMW